MADITREIDRIQEVWESYDLNSYFRERWNREDFEEIVNSERYKESFPEKKLDRKFRELLRPFHYFFGSKTIYCKLSRIAEDEEGENEYIFSVINPRMISVDQAFFGDEFNPEGKTSYSIIDLLYKPYIYELSFPNVPDFVKEAEEGVWYEIKIAKHDWFLLTVDERKERFGEEEGGGRYNGFEAERDLNEEELKEFRQKYDIYSGRLSYGASPLDIRKVNIRWYKTIAISIGKPLDLNDKTVNDYCAKQSPVAINNQIKKLFHNDSHRKVIVKRFGQANAIIVKNEKKNGDKVSFAFDLGLPLDINLEFDADNNVDTVASQIFDSVNLSSFNPQVIFISHWHLDHYRAVYTLNRDVYLGKKASVWIVPKYMAKNSSSPLSTDRLISFLINTKKVLFVDEPNKPNYFEEIYNSSSVSLYRVKKDSKLNNDCIILQLNQTLMTGDCDYENWVYDCKRTDTVKCLIVPHHGDLSSKTPTEESKLKTDYANLEYAYFCVGKNEYGHPEDEIKEMFEEASHLYVPNVLYTNDSQRRRRDFVFIDK